MDAFHNKGKFVSNQISPPQAADCDRLRRRLRQWQQVRSWARLIREAEMLWHDEQKALRRLGALELAQLIKEIPPSYRRRVDLWLIKYSVGTRLIVNKWDD